MWISTSMWILSANDWSTVNGCFMYKSGQHQWPNPPLVLPCCQQQYQCAYWHSKKSAWEGGENTLFSSFRPPICRMISCVAQNPGWRLSSLDPGPLQPHANQSGSVINSFILRVLSETDCAWRKGLKMTDLGWTLMSLAILCWNHVHISWVLFKCLHVAFQAFQALAQCPSVPFPTSVCLPSIYNRLLVL